MKEPTFDKAGYPTEATLEVIEKWKHPFTKETASEFLDFCIEAWNHTCGQVFISGLGLEYEFITGGWSGNESIIGAMQENHLFWGLCWQESKRGGYYKFSIERLCDE